MRYTENYIKSFEKIIPTIRNIEMLRNSSVLITGASGLICSNLVDFLMYLNRYHGFNIRIFAAARSEQSINRRFGENSEQLQYIQYDALCPFRIDFDVDYIIHGAGNANPRAYTEEPVETMLANFNGMMEILEYARKNQVRRVLYISSSEVYGAKADRLSEPYDENDYGAVDILDVRSCYPSSKRAAETLCAAYFKEYGVDSVIVRPGHIYGPSFTSTDNRAYAQFARDALSHRDIVMKSPGTQLRSYCYVGDCSSAILAVLLNGKTGDAYNISNSGSIITIQQLAASLAKAGNVNVVYANPSDKEKAGYTKMENSALRSNKLEQLDWFSCFSLDEGCQLVLECGEV